jgi:hypothetical protein
MLNKTQKLRTRPAFFEVRNNSVARMIFEFGKGGHQLITVDTTTKELNYLRALKGKTAQHIFSHEKQFLKDIDYCYMNQQIFIKKTEFPSNEHLQKKLYTTLFLFSYPDYVYVFFFNMK